MRQNRSMPPCDVIPELAYPDVAAAVAWLAAVFDFRPRLLISDHRAQLDIGRGALVVTKQADIQLAQPMTYSIMVRLPDLDTHYRRAVARGARILRPPEDYPFGERQYTVSDLAGHVWTFSQTIGDIAPESWGGTWATDT